MNATTTAYRCSTCQGATVLPSDDDLPMCSNGCGLLFEDEVETTPTAPKPVARFLKFRLLGSGFLAGDDRSYEVLYRGQYLGEIDPTWLVSSVEGGEPIRGFAFRSTDGSKYGEGKTRAAAVLAAF